MLNLIPKYFIVYKFFNSLFLGMSVGAIFILYAPLEPSIYSIGGIVLAVGMLIVSRLYVHILNVLWFFRISFVIEIVLFFAIAYYLIYPYHYQTALMLYIVYQITFIFGSYLVRAETLLLSSNALLTKVDTVKQLGYLIGMALAYLFYQMLIQQDISDKQEQVYYLHFILLILEVVIIGFVLKSFKKIAS